MFENITNEHCLFYVSDIHLTQFKELAQTLQPLLNAQIPTTINAEAAIYNVWLLFNDRQQTVCFNESRRFAHSSHRYFFDTLKSHALLSSRITKATDEREIFLLAYFFGMAFTTWLNELAIRQQRWDVLNTLSQPNYYSVQEQHFTATQFDYWLSIQKTLTILIQQDLKHENFLKYHIHHALFQTKEICATNFFIES